MNTRRRIVAAGALLAVALLGSSLRAQVGQGIMDLNSMSEKDLLALPHMSPAAVTAFIASRPFPSIVEANAFLLGQKLTQDQAKAIYDKAFVLLNLNTATPAEINLIPRIGPKMAHEFDEYRPWKTWAQFDKEIGKYVGAEETNRLKKYVFIPINLNTATDDVIMTIPGMTSRMLREFKEYRPWKSKEHFEKEIGKYVNAKETARLWRYVVIQ